MIPLFHPVIASEAKQSIARRKERMDCFVASAPRNDGDRANNTSHDTKQVKQEKMTSIPEDRIPVIVGVGEIADRPKDIAAGLEPLALLE